MANSYCQSSAVVIASVIVALICRSGHAQPNPPSEQGEMLEQVYAQLESGDSLEAIDLIEKGDTKDVVNAYSQLVSDLYFKKHDVPRMILIGRAGIRYCLSSSKQTEDAQLAEKLKGAAKTMAYNVSANAWPGWQDEGIKITRTDSIVALDLARLNLRLAEELKREADVFSNAHWLVGAQHLALRELDEADKHFGKAVEFAKTAKKPEAEQMARGYGGIVKLVADANSNEGKKQLAGAIRALNEIGSDDAKFFAQQLDSVSKFFAK